jgi:heme exporter protein D
MGYGRIIALGIISIGAGIFAGPLFLAFGIITTIIALVVKLWADDKKRKKTILEQQFQLQQQQQQLPEQPNKEKEVITITTRIHEEQSKINLHTSTRNVELKNQDISEQNNQITKTIGSPFYKLISNSVKTQNNNSAPKSDITIAVPGQPVSENGKMPSAIIPTDETTQIPINETESSIDNLSSHTADSVRTLINDETTKENNSELLQILKMRLVRGEISKEQYLELRKMIEL